MNQSDHAYMAQAIALAALGRFTTTPNPNVGCVIVNNQQIVGEGFHLRAGEAHAEVNALRMAGEKAHGATAYVTLEPCNHYGRVAPCVDALIHAGITRVVAAMQDPNPQVAGKGLARLQQAGIAVSCGLMQQQAEALNPGFLKRMRTGLPYVQLKLGISLDGRTAMASGQSQWITSVESRQDVQVFRAQSSAILSSSATVLADDPALTVRWSELPAAIQEIYPHSHFRAPPRVIIDSQNRIKPEHKVIHGFGETWLVRIQPNQQAFPADSVKQLAVNPRANGQVDLLALMQLLGQKQINTVWVEGGAKLAGALLQQNLLDELIVYMSPKLLGDDARGLCHLPGLTELAQAPQFQFQTITPIGQDLRLILKPMG